MVPPRKKRRKKNEEDAAEVDLDKWWLARQNGRKKKGWNTALKKPREE